MTTKQTSKKKTQFQAPVGTMTVRPWELARNRALVNEIAARAKTAVYIDGDGKRKVIRRNDG